MSWHNKVLYDTNERQKIVDHIIQKNLYFNLRGRCVWQEMEKLEICPGRTWQSMKQHFQKHIIYSLDSLNINETEKNRILNCYYNNYKCIQVKRKELSSTSSNETDNDNNATKKFKVQSLRYKFVVQKSPENINNFLDNFNRTTHENINNEKMESKQHRDIGDLMMDKLNNLTFTNDDNGKNACGTEVDSSIEDSYSEEEDLSIIIYIKENMNWTNLQYFDSIYNDCQRDVLVNRSAKSIKKRFIDVILPNIYKYRIVDIDEIPLFYDRACVDMPINFEQVLEDYMKNNVTSSVESISTPSTKSYENSNIQNISLNENIQNSVIRNSEIVSGNIELSYEKSFSKMLHEESNKDALLHHNEKNDIQLQTNDSRPLPIGKSVMRNSEMVSGNNELSCDNSFSKMLRDESNKDALLHHNEKIDSHILTNADFKSQAEFLPAELLNLRPLNFKKIETLQSDCSCELLRPVKTKSRVVHLPVNVKHIKNNKYLEKICKCCTEVKPSMRKKSNKKKNCRKLDAPDESNELKLIANCKKNEKSAVTSSNDSELNSLTNMEDTDLSKNIFSANIDDIVAKIEIDSISEHSSPIISMSKRNKIKLVNIDGLLSTEIELCNKLTPDGNILVNAHLNSIKSRSCSPSISLCNDFKKEDYEEVCDKLNVPNNCVEENVKEEPSPENNINVADEISFIANLPKLPENLKEQYNSLNKVDYWLNNSLVINAKNNNFSLSLYDINSNKGKLLPELTSRLVNKEIDYNVEENNFEPYSPKLIQNSKDSNSEELITVKDEIIFNNVVDGEGCDFPIVCNEILEEKFNPDEEIKNESSDSSLVSYNKVDCKEETVSEECITLINEEDEQYSKGKLSSEYFTCFEVLPYRKSEDSIEEHFRDEKHNELCSPELLDKVECLIEKEQIKVEHENLSENHIDDVIEKVNNSNSISMKETLPYRTPNCLEKEIELLKEEPFEEYKPKLFETEFPFSPVKNSVEIKMEEKEIDINILFSDTEIIMQIKLEEDPLNTDNYEEQNEFDVKIKTEDVDLLNNVPQVKMEENTISLDHSYFSVYKYNTRKTYKNNMLLSKKSKKLLEEENVKCTNFLQSILLSFCHISTNSLENTDLDVDTSINDVTLTLNFEGNHSFEFNIPDFREIRLSCGMQCSNFSHCEDAATVT